MTIGKLEKSVNLGRGRITQALKLLELDGAVARDGGRYLRTAEPVGAGRGADRAGHRRAPRGARADAGVHAPRRLPHGVPHPAARRPGSGAVRPVRELHGDGVATDRGRRAGPGSRLVPAPGPAVDQAAADVGRRTRWTACPAGSRRRTRSGWRCPCSATPAGGGRCSAGGTWTAAFSRELVDATAQGDPRALAPDTGAGLGHGRAVAHPARAGRGVRPGPRRAPGPALRRASSRSRDGAEPQTAMQNSVQQLRNAHDKLGDRRLGGPGRAGPARRRPRRLRLDADRRRLAAARAGERRGPPVRARGRERPRRLSFAATAGLMHMFRGGTMDPRTMHISGITAAQGRISRTAIGGGSSGEPPSGISPRTAYLPGASVRT